MREWQYKPSALVNKSIAEGLTVFPRERDMTHSFFRIFWNMFWRGILKIYFRLSIQGKENLPQGQSFILIANHSSHLDAVVLTSLLPIKSIDHAFSVAAKDYFFTSFWNSWFSAVLINALPFDRQKNKKESLELCGDVLNVSENVLIMFPEGTRSLTGEIQTFKQGIGILATGADYSVVPAYIHGAYEAFPKGRKFPKPNKVRVIIGKPLSFKDFERNQQEYEKVAHICEAEVRSLKESLNG